MIAQKYFNRKLPIHFFRFLYDVYKSDKLVELLSYVVWEIKFRLGGYKQAYLSFSDRDPLVFERNKELQSDTLIIDRSTIDWHVLFIQRDSIFGSTNQYPTKLFSYKQSELRQLADFKNEIQSIYISKQNVIFICTCGALYKLNAAFEPYLVLQFSSTISIFRQHCAFTENEDGTLFIGEYANIWDKQKGYQFVGYLYFSTDDGQNWNQCDFLKKNGINKHIHLVKWSSRLSTLILTDGDNKKKLWINQSQQYNSTAKSPVDGWFDCTRFHINRGGHATMIETADYIVFGSDYMGGTNCLLKTKDLKTFDIKIIPEPYRRGYFYEMITTGDKVNPMIWANLKCSFWNKQKSLIMMSDDCGETWHKIIEYDGTVYDMTILNNSTQENQAIFIRANYIEDQNRAETFSVRVL